MATNELLLVQVPPDEGDNWVVVPIHIEVDPMILTTGLPITVNGPETLDTQVVEVDVNVNVTEPAEIPTTIPAFVI